ncbi:MAG: hypothetical protein KME05_20450 [Gloeocapsa sp. UFS-A4-WI-NPMV-4B04]|nr:hypothetical protein [Gloeocapsa sp. UFS-A4-WI-NPMV-4B04]
MAKEFNNSADYNLARSQVEQELLELLLAADNETYPWNTTDPEAEVYFTNQENLPLEDASEAEIELKEQAFFNQLAEIWFDTTSRDVSETE